MSEQELETLLNTETGEMGVRQFKQFMKKLVKALDANWEDYVVMTCSSDDIAVARVCEDCGNPRTDDRYYFALSEDVVEAMAEDGEEDVLGVEDVFEAVNMDDCTCDDDE